MKEFTEPMVEIIELSDDLIVASSCDRVCELECEGYAPDCPNDCAVVCRNKCYVVG